RKAAIIAARVAGLGPAMYALKAVAPTGGSVDAERAWQGPPGHARHAALARRRVRVKPQVPERARRTAGALARDGNVVRQPRVRVNLAGDPLIHRPEDRAPGKSLPYRQGRAASGVNGAPESAVRKRADGAWWFPCSGATQRTKYHGTSHLSR